MEYGEQPDYVQAVLETAQQAQLIPLNASRTSRFSHRLNPIVICVIRDELAHLPHFLSHYRRLGIQQFKFIDNGSRDGSVDYLLQQPDVTVLQTLEPFNAPTKQGWITRLIQETGYHLWYLVVDADERVEFDRADAYGFADLTAKMESIGLLRVRGMMVDMYAQGKLRDQLQGDFSEGLKAATWFDAESHDEQHMQRMISRKGGPRRRVFATDAYPIDPELTKYPLFRPDPDEVMADPHHLFPYAANFASPCYLGILHYKFLPGMNNRVDTAIKEANYWQGSIEYQAYRSALVQQPDLELYFSGSGQYHGPASLLEAGLMDPIAWDEDRGKRMMVGAKARLSGMRDGWFGNGVGTRL